jgi:hypothetical protein
MYDIQIMPKKISLLIKKLLKNTLLYPIMDHTKTIKLLFIRLKIKHNALILWDHVIQFFTRWYQWYNTPFNSTYKKVLFFLYVLMIGWQESPMAIKKAIYHHLLRWRPCYFFIQYGQTNFSCVLQLKTISYTRKSLIVYIKAAFI